jgi:aspartokinase
MTHTSSVITILEKTFQSELQNQTIDRIWAGPEVVIVTAVCPRMRQRFGVAGKIFSVLAENEVNVLAIAHGSSEVSISMVVQVVDLPRTVLALHQLTLPNGDQTIGGKP